MNLPETTQTRIQKRLFILISFFSIAYFVVSCERGESDCKDFEVAIIGTDYAEVEIRSYPDSIYLTSETYDSEFVKTIHFTKINSGKYIITAYCPYPILKSNLVSKVVNYSGGAGSYDIYFEKK